MGNITWSVPNDESANVAGSSLDSLANGAVSNVLTDIVNTATKALYVALWIELGSLTPTTNGNLKILFRRKRGSTYSDANATVHTGESVTVQLLPTIGAKYIAIDGILLRGPFTYGLQIVQNAGVSLAASGNAVYYQTYTEAG